MSKLRIISLIASSTELLCALGFQDQLVGISHECDYPLEVTRLPVCTEAKVHSDIASVEIDTSIKNILAQGLSVYRVKPDLLRELKPDVIVTQDHCAVCAVSLRDVEDALCQYTASAVKVVSLRPNCMADIYRDIEHLADKLDAPERGTTLCNDMQERMAAIAKRASKTTPPHKLACIEWIDPLMACGNWIPELVEQLGCINCFGKKGEHSKTMVWEEILTADPDSLIFMPCGFPIERTLEEANLFSNQEVWPELRAVQAGRVFIADGNQFFNRPGPRLVESLEILAEIAFPQVFDTKYAGQGWTCIFGK